MRISIVVVGCLVMSFNFGQCFLYIIFIGPVYHFKRSEQTMYNTHHVLGKEIDAQVKDAKKKANKKHRCQLHAANECV